MNWHKTLVEACVFSFGWAYGAWQDAAWYWFPAVFLGWMLWAIIFEIAIPAFRRRIAT